MHKYLILFDFDGTQFDTFSPGPKGLGVREASYLAINDVLGANAASVYATRSDLYNYAPSEIVNLFTSNGQSRAIQEQANEFHCNNRDSLTEVVPKDKGVVLSGVNSNAEISELLVRQKLKYLVGQVGDLTASGEIWPMPTRGFAEFWKLLNSLKEKNGEQFSITTGVVSSGHEVFIRKAFEEHHLTQPDILISEDDIRGRKNPPLENPREAIRRYKPGLLPIALAHREWLKKLDLTGNSFSLKDSKQSREKIMYFGDDLKKDGEMAFASDISFGHFKKDFDSPMQRDKKHITFGNWNEIGIIFSKKQSLLKDGAALREVFAADFFADIESHSGRAVELTMSGYKKEMLY